MTIRNFCILAIACLMSAAANAREAAGAAPPVQSGPPEMVVTLLGTSTPDLSERRFGFSVLVQAGGLNLVFDAGRGAAIRLGQLRMRPSEVDAVFLTHFHSDHINGLADLWMTGYLGAGRNGRKMPLELYGPHGTEKLARGMMETYQADATIRFADEPSALPASRIAARDAAPGVVFERAGVKVTMFQVFHGAEIEPAMGYRVDYAGRSVTLSGDTQPHPNVEKFGAGADVLIHEVALAPGDIELTPRIREVLAHHTSPEEAGALFRRAAPRLAVYSHISRLPGPRGRATLEDLVKRTRTAYAGPLAVGEDLMRIRIGEGISILQMQDNF
ncbi:Ribonuclease Z [Pigmentiphaga humi]|uniref:Ribonuclease Z n=1 Tax=Pigmentiphaga humi TaxID=2478468 RepID=A0A3P4B720_9BURK|nr:MBL fold metallo-hydrolase [Pigmentiphaga humi]VCU71862.1 Ribonuclease Z [Pigmentiphaga humi]